MDASTISAYLMWNCSLLLFFNLSLVLVIFTNVVSAEEHLKNCQIAASLHDAVGAGNIEGSVTKVRSSASEKDGNFPEGNQLLPIKRIRNSDFLRVKSKYHRSTLGEEVPEGPHHYAVQKMPKGEYLGAQAAFSVWKPKLSSPLQVSIAQVWLVSTDSSLPMNTIEAGWMVHPNLYGDWEPYFFTFYTNDSYQTDCFNNMCGTFTQVSSKIFPGTKLVPVSDMDGGQTEIFLHIRKNSTSGDWWLYFGENMEAVGYWAKEVFNSLREHADSIEWGGETSSGGSSSYPGMGSSWFAEDGYHRAAFVRTMKYVDTHYQEHDAPSPLDHIVTNELCYTIDDRGTNFIFGRHFLYGGPGGEC